MILTIRKKKRILFILALVLVVFSATFTDERVEAAVTCKSVISYPGTTKSRVNIRKKAGVKYKSYGMVAAGTDVTILGYVKNGGVTWYKCKTTLENGKKKTGYISSSYVKKVSKPVGVVNNKVTSTLNVRKKAKTTSKALIKIPKKTEATILSIKKSSGKYWYKIKVSYSGKTKTGYVLGDYIDINTPNKEDIPKEEDTQINLATDADFATQLAAFPEGYKAAISALKETYPNWSFVAIDTGLDWNEAVKAESVVGRNVIQSNYPNGIASLAPLSYLSKAEGAYDITTNKYKVFDGYNWYSAAPEVIAYYMDPRNFINDTDIFQFETLSYDESQSGTVVESILKDTFMNGNYSVTDIATGQIATGSYVQAFMDAGKNSGANPYFLAARCKQEVGMTGSGSTTGTYKGYEGIYNFYNIGATDGSNAVAKGLLWAKGGSNGATTYNRPWTTPYKSIIGGASYIAQNYIAKGQNTLYFQKFNVKPIDPNQTYLHQYMTNVQAAWSEGRTTRNAYSSLRILSDTMVFYIPVYNNMPETACALPAAN